MCAVCANAELLVEQVAHTQALKEKTVRSGPIVGQLITAPEELHVQMIKAVLPALHTRADYVPSNPFFTFALANAYRVLGHEERSESLFSLATERAATDAGLLLSLAGMYEKQGLLEHRENAYDALLGLSISSGYSSRPLLGDYFFRRGIERLRGGERSEALNEFERALQFDPYSLSANLTAIRLNAGSLKGKAVTQMFALYRAVKASYFSQQLILLNSLRGATICVLIVAIAFLLGICFKNLPAIQHRLYEILPSIFPHAYRSSLAWLVVATPMIWLWSIFLLLIIPIYLFGVWLSAMHKERVLIVMLFGYLIFIPYFLSTESKLLRPVDPEDRVNLLARAQQSGYEPSLAAQLQSHVKRNPSDFESTFSLGLLQKRGGLFEDAISTYNAAFDLRPRSSSVRNNLGNTYFVQGEYDKAMEEYEAAVRLDPGSAVPHYNLAQVYSEKLMLTESSQELNKALELDFRSVNEFRKTAGEKYHLRVMEVAIPSSHLWRVLFRTEVQDGKSPAVGSLFGGYPWLLSLASVGFFVLAIAFGILLRRAGLDYTCLICGAQGCFRCLEDEVCPRCTKKIVVTDSTSMKERLEQKLRSRAQRYRRIKSLVLSIVVPGSGHVFLGSTWKGVAFSLVYSIVLTNMFFKGLFIKFSPFVQVEAGPTQAFAVAGVIFIMYAFCIRSVMKTLALEEV